MPGQIVIEHSDAAFEVDPRAVRSYDYINALYLHASTFGIWLPTEDKVSLDVNEKVESLASLGNGETLSSIFDQSRPDYDPEGYNGLPTLGFLKAVGVRGRRFDKGDNPSGMTFPAGASADWTRIIVMKSEPLVTDGGNALWNTTTAAGSIRLNRGHNANNGEFLAAAVGTIPDHLPTVTWPNIPTGVPMAAFNGWDASAGKISLSVNGYAPLTVTDAAAQATQTLIALGSTLGGTSNEGFTGEILAFGIDTMNLLDDTDAAAVAKYAIWKQWIRDRFPYLKTVLI